MFRDPNLPPGCASAEGGRSSRCSPVSLQRTGSSAGGRSGSRWQGASMRPTLEPGDWAIAVRARARAPRRRRRRRASRAARASSSSSASSTSPATWRPTGSCWSTRSGSRGTNPRARPTAGGSDRCRSSACAGGCGGCGGRPARSVARPALLIRPRLTPGCGISHRAGSICSCNDPDTLPWSRRGDDPRPMLLSRGARRGPLGLAHRHRPPTAPPHHDRSQGGSVRWTSSPPPWTLGASPAPGRSSRCTRR